MYHYQATTFKGSHCYIYFDQMDVKQIKAFISVWGVLLSTDQKPELIQSSPAALILPFTAVLE